MSMLWLLRQAHGILVTCSPTFHESFISGSDETKMRWEYCTKMTFSKSGYAEWHSMASYTSQSKFKKLFINYLMEHKHTDKDAMDANKHLIQIDLAIYDEAQWQKMLHEIEVVKTLKQMDREEQEATKWGSFSPMSCEERLSHAIQVDKIKIYPNSSAIIEKTRKRYVQESFDDRVASKHANNEYNRLYQTREEHAKFDREDHHELMQQMNDQTWYFVLADCRGSLEIMEDEVTKRDHLLGLSALWQEIQESDYEGFEESNEKDMQQKREMFGKRGKFRSDSWQENNLIMENTAEQMRTTDTAITQDQAEDDDDDFDFNEYVEENKLESLEDFQRFSKENFKHGLKQMPIRVQLTILNTGSHFSEDKFNLCILNFIFLFIFLGLSIVNFKRYKEDQARFEEEDSPLYFTFGSMNMVILHCLLKAYHNFYFAQDGVGSMISEMLAHVMQVFSRITVVTLLIAFGFGWQVIYENTIEVKKKIQYVYISVLLMTAYEDYALSNWIREHPADLFHLIQSNIQWTFYATRMFEFAIFSFAIWRSKRVNNKKYLESMQKIEDDQGTELKQLELQSTFSSNIYHLTNQFYNQLMVFGSLFFFSIPLSTMVSASYMSESNQLMFQTMAITLSQLSVYLFLLYMLTNKSSKFHAATFRNQALLPGKLN